ncbi:hypothetical protein HPB52_000720 [Rhipicephalus sanguineus]|uniref:HTH psq-type domain-containing protein n=1 Tax=Rhipicephalus sanguineus TaxID=34632 RepID=A0A9D4T859_RHISA|nr:hypothetical protein HPB52_000720 [Rhipicephalus sanguineus]
MADGDCHGKRKRKTITIEQKAAMLKAVESGVKKKKVAQDFGVALSMIPQACKSMTRETTIDLYMAIEMLQAAWMSVTASLIANCFWHASFGVNSGGDSEDISAAANEGAAGDQDLASWDALLDAGVPDCDTFCMYRIYSNIRRSRL